MSGTVQEIPLSSSPQTLTVSLAGVTYNLRVNYHNVDDGGWFLDIADVNADPLINGIPLICGANLLEQYAYMGFPGQLFVASDGDLTAPPTYENLGTSSHLYFVTPP